MCGIFGFYGIEDKKLISQMGEVISYRGPDDTGYYFDRDLMLGHKRLSIIDLRTGKQPIFNEDKSICVIFNGEIYNFIELREELEKAGHRFYTDTDTEVIVHSYEEYGFECVKRFNGMFAFAIWDGRKKALFLARDRAGVKPLFYTKAGNVFLFASEVKAILQYPILNREMDEKSLHYFINLRYIPGERTIFKEIYKLLPGHFLIYQQDKLTIKKYWELELNEEDKPLEYFIKKMRTALTETIKRQLISDVPVAAYLSGGLDSSTIVAIASKHTERLKTFCLGFDEPTDEFRDARRVAEAFNTEHYELTVKFDVLKSIPETIWHIDTPKRNMWPYYIAKEISRHVKVVLSGLGGDEVLGGYVQRYDFVNSAEKMRRIGISHNELKSAELRIKELISNGEIGHDNELIELERISSIKHDSEIYTLITHHNKLYSNPEYLKNVYSNHLTEKGLPLISGIFEPYFRNSGNILNGTFIAEFKTKLADDFLPVEDACSMAHSLESRVPFLDNEMVGLGFSIPSQYKFFNGEGKIVLKKAMKGILPKEIIEKKKAGFAPNVMTWYKNEFRDFAEDIFPRGNCVRKYFNMNFINKILQSNIDERLTTHYNLIWDLICLEVWHRIYIENDDLLKPELRIDRLF